MALLPQNCQPAARLCRLYNFAIISWGDDCRITPRFQLIVIIAKNQHSSIGKRTVYDSLSIAVGESRGWHRFREAPLRCIQF